MKTEVIPGIYHNNDGVLFQVLDVMEGKAHFRRIIRPGHRKPSAHSLPTAEFLRHFTYVGPRLTMEILATQGWS